MTEQDVDRDAGGEDAEEPEERPSPEAADSTASAEDDGRTAVSSDADADVEATSEQRATGETADESIDDIAEKPEGDIDEALTDIVEDESDSGVETGEHSSEKESVDGKESADGEESADVDDSADESLVADVREAAPERIASAIELLREEIEELEAELAAERERAEDLESRLKRKQADFQNYKKRQKRKLEDEKQRATEDLVERLLDVRDNLLRALEQDEDVDIRDGVQTTLDQFDHELDRENVEPIEPEPGDSVDPQRHEVLATVDSDRPADTIAHVHRPGYRMAEKVLRPAQVAVSDGSDDDAAGDSDAGNESNADDEAAARGDEGRDGEPADEAAETSDDPDDDAEADGPTDASSAEE